MGGFLGLGGSSAKTDRGNQLAATQGQWGIFNYGLPTGQAEQATGQGTLNQATSGFQNLLNATVPGRTQTIQNAAPAINAATASADAQRRQEATTGTGRSGGTVEQNREQGATTSANIDNIISQQLGLQQQQQTQKQIAGAQGLAQVGTAEQLNAGNLLGLGANADTNILQNATESRAQSYNINQNTQAQAGQAVGSLIIAGLAM